MLDLDLQRVPLYTKMEQASGGKTLEDIVKDEPLNLCTRQPELAVQSLSTEDSRARFGQIRVQRTHEELTDDIYRTSSFLNIHYVVEQLGFLVDNRQMLVGQSFVLNKTISP